MSPSSLAESARREGIAWTEERSRRVLANTMRVREERVARARALRRALVVVTAPAAIVVVLLRGASAPAGASTVGEGTSAMIAAHGDSLERSSDGGYVRD